MIPLFMSEERVYSGLELRPGFAAEMIGKPLGDDMLVAWIGPAHVSRDNLVDIEDRLKGDEIHADRMLHFVVELFGHGLYQTVLFQHWFVEVVTSRVIYLKGNEGAWIETRGDDIMVEHNDDSGCQSGKLTVSIATVSPVSGLIHLGLNVSVAGIPDTVVGACLDDLLLPPKRLAIDVIHLVADRYKKMLAATCKVLPR